MESEEFAPSQKLRAGYWYNKLAWEIPIVFGGVMTASILGILPRSPILIGPGLLVVVISRSLAPHIWLEINRGEVIVHNFWVVNRFSLDNRSTTIRVGTKLEFREGNRVVSPLGYTISDTYNPHPEKRNRVTRNDRDRNRPATT